MPSLREIRIKIKSVKQTQQVTKAMKMIAASRLKRAQGQLLASRPYAQKVEELVSDLSRRLLKEGRLMPQLLKPRPDAKERLLVVFTADKGLCGSYNVVMLRETLKYYERIRGEGGSVHCFVVGKKGRDFLVNHGFQIAREFVQFLRRPAFSQAEIIGKEIVDYYVSHPGIAGVDICYMDFRSVVRQIPAVYRLLPPGLGGQQEKAEAPFDYIYEPGREKILEELIPRYVNTELYRLVFEAYTSEQASRLNVMENATKNAGDLISDLSLLANQVRQASITRELLEVVSGAEALS
ncbi:MAG: ATP synthase F1 subunit gamma [Elusimicrobia bacterium]|nr:ATP synthase F1 subunit gamma [Elusimicrobiota bacterium]